VISSKDCDGRGYEDARLVITGNVQGINTAIYIYAGCTIWETLTES
jgi:hypothetical protein